MTDKFDSGHSTQDDSDTVGVIYTKKHVVAQHGGVLKDDTNVALLVVNPFKPDKSINKETVYTTQVSIYLLP